MNFWEPFTWKYHLTALSRRRSLDEMKDNKGFGLWIETTTRMFSIPRMPGIFNVGTATVVSKTNVKPWPENDETNSCEGKTMSPCQNWPERRDEFVRGKDNESVPVLTRKTRRMRAKERRLVRDESETTTASRDASVSIVEIVGSDWKWIQRLTWERERKIVTVKNQNPKTIDNFDVWKEDDYLCILNSPIAPSKLTLNLFQI